MINVNELRLGNRIQLHFTDGQEDRKASYNWIEVKSIERDMIRWMTPSIFGGLLHSGYEPEKCHPIMLTEEHLIENGFEKYEMPDYDTIRWDKGTFSLYQEAWGDYVGEDFNYATREKYGTFKSGFVVRTLHQLQNLYYETERKELIESINVKVTQ